MSEAVNFEASDKDVMGRSAVLSSWRLPPQRAFLEAQSQVRLKSRIFIIPGNHMADVGDADMSALEPHCLQPGTCARQAVRIKVIFHVALLCK